MEFICCILRARDQGRVVELQVCLQWSVCSLRARAEEVLGFRVHTLKFNRRELVDFDDLKELGLRDGCSIFVNSPSLTGSAPVCGSVGFGGSPVLAGEAALGHSGRWLGPVQVCGFPAEVVAQRIETLMSLGFPRELVEKAMKAAALNIDRAADYLVSGHVPEPLVIEDRFLSPRRVDVESVLDSGFFSVA